MHINRKVSRFAVCTTASVAVLGLQAGAASAKTLKITVKATANKPGQVTDLTSKLSSPQLGKGIQTGTAKLPVLFLNWKFKGGTLKVKSQGTLQGSKVVDDKWTVLKTSTGKFKGAKGGGTGTGDVATGKFKFTGKIKLK